MKISIRRIVVLSILMVSSQLFSQKTAVFILGAPRSGTSATTGCLKLMGLELGQNLSVPQSWNPKGDFEDQDTIDVNRSVLRILGLSPYGTFLRDFTVMDDKYTAAKALVKEHLSKHFASYSRFGIKHPKMCLLLPLYIESAQELGYKVLIVKVRRNPVEIITSLNKTIKQSSNILDLERGLEYINAFTSTMDMFSAGHPTIEVQFTDLIHNTEQVLNSLVEFITGISTYQNVSSRIEDFLNKKPANPNASN